VWPAASATGAGPSRAGAYPPGPPLTLATPPPPKALKRRSATDSARVMATMMTPTTAVSAVSAWSQYR
jgi:hypothetical protein